MRDFVSDKKNDNNFVDSNDFDGIGNQGRIPNTKTKNRAIWFGLSSDCEKKKSLKLIKASDILFKWSYIKKAIFTSEMLLTIN